VSIKDIGGEGPLIFLSPVGRVTAGSDLAVKAARRARGELVSARRVGHGAIFLPVRSGIDLMLARASSLPWMITWCSTPLLLTNVYPILVQEQHSQIQASLCYPIQCTA